MTNKISLANKYRPKDFESIVGQDAIKTILRQQIKTGNIKNVYLFAGSAGCGKTTAGRIVANEINDNLVKPLEIDCASHNSVDDVRALIEECKYKPINGKYKSFLLDECHLLSPQAWGALLKLLEEPPEYVVIILCTTDPQKILGTILSRVQRFNFQRLTVDEIFNRLIYILNNENIITYKADALKYIARLARGGMRTAITTLEKCLDYSHDITLDNVIKVTSGGVSEDMLITFTNFLLSRDCRGALLYFNDIYMQGIEPSLFMKLYVEFLDNCIKYAVTQVADITILSNNAIEWINGLQDNVGIVRDLLTEALYINSTFSSEDLKIYIESWIIRLCK